MRRSVTFFIILLIHCLVKKEAVAQRYSLFHSNTLYNSFESPSESTFHSSISREYAISFLFSNIGLSGLQNGSSQKPIRESLFAGTDLDYSKLSTVLPNILAADANMYLFMFKKAQSPETDYEYGASWQIRTNGYLGVNSQLINLMKDYSQLEKMVGIPFAKNTLTAQSYHQLSFSIRKDLNPYISIGAKLGLLSGIYYIDGSTGDMKLNDVDVTNLSMSYNVNAKLRAASGYGNLVQTESNSLKFENPNQFQSVYIPNFKNPGLAISLGTTIKTNGGLKMTFNLKDFGFIAWKGYEYNANASGSITGSSVSDVSQQMIDNLKLQTVPKATSFMAPTNSIFDFGISQKMAFYKPVFVIGKSLTLPVGYMALIHNIDLYPVVLTFSTGMDYTNLFETESVNIGGQIMYKKENGEFYIGCEHINKTYQIVRNFQDKANNLAPEDALAFSFYLGYSYKFGRVTEHKGVSAYNSSQETLWEWLFGWRTHRRYHSGEPILTY